MFVLPTLYEGYGMAVAEALARGLPVVSTNTGAIAELVGDDAGHRRPAGRRGRRCRAGARRRCWTIRLGHPSSGLRTAPAGCASTLPTWDDAANRMDAVLSRVSG